MKLNSTEATRISGLSVVDQSRLSSRGMSRVTKDHGKFFYDEIGILNLVVVRTLRKGGLELDAIKPLSEFICGLSFDELDLASEAGLYIVAAPGLEPQFAPPTAAALNRGPDSYLVYIPVFLFWGRVKTSVEALERHAGAGQ